MKILFYTSSEHLIFEAPLALMTEMFAFGRDSEGDIDNDDAFALFQKLISQADKLGGNAGAINVAFSAIIQAGHRLNTKELTPFLQNPADDCLIIGTTATHSVVKSLDLIEFEEQVKLHDAFNVGVHGTVGLA
jgi:hypothetical protein